MLDEWMKEFSDANPLPPVPRPMSLVKFDFDRVDASYHSNYPFTRKGVYVFLGEIANMGGHCIVVDHKTGQIHSGYHTENFVELAEDEC
jgi:hypothetical protein